MLNYNPRKNPQHNDQKFYGKFLIPVEQYSA